METLFLAAMQSSFLLGLIHGVNPCGHSWLVLAPVVTVEKRGRRVAAYTIAFLSGTAAACLVLGATLGTLSSFLPPSAGWWMELVTSLVLLFLGVLLLYKPALLHAHHEHHDHHDHHEHEHDHRGQHEAHHHHDDHGCPGPRCQVGQGRRHKWLVPTFFGIGFVNMIIPCPTAAVMYGYALNSGSAVDATLVFGSYAVSTALAVGLVIYLIFKATSLAGRLQKDWLEPLIMRLAGAIIVIFSGYELYTKISFPPL